MSDENKQQDASEQQEQKPEYCSVGKVDELWDGEASSGSKQVDLVVGGEAKATVLLTKTDEKTVYATSHKCTHFGAPLAKGATSGCRVVCPWHGAAFNVKSGDVEDAPGLAALDTYDVRVTDDGEVQVAIQPRKRRNKLEGAADDDRTFLIVGGGAAGFIAAKTLREEGFNGRVVLASADETLPIDRTKLSKAAHLPVDKLVLRDVAWFKEQRIEVMLNHEVTGIDAAAKKATFKDGTTIEYSEVLLATGSRSRQLPELDAAKFSNVFTVRGAGDTTELAAGLESGKIKNVLFVGAGFINLELGAWMSKYDLDSVTYLTRDARAPLQNVLGEQVGQMIKAQHENKNDAQFLAGSIANVNAADGAVTSVTISLKSGDDQGDEKASTTDVSVDAVVVAIGAVLNTEFLRDNAAFSDMDKRGALPVNGFLKHLQSGAFVAGDIASFPYLGASDMVRIEHWNVAQQHGRVAALNMMGRSPTPFTTVPFFWSGQYGSIRYCGHVAGGAPDKIIVDGEPLKDNKFAAFYIKNGKAVAFASAGRDPLAAAATELIRLDAMPSVSDLEGGDVGLVARLAKVSPDAHRSCVTRMCGF